MLEALNEAGVAKDSEVWKRAVKFVERCQNRSESNDGPGFDKLGVVVGDDGGFFYRPGESKAEKQTLPNGKESFRSYGSMTYAGYKSLIFAGLGKDDPRVKAALGWIQKNYTLDENPGMGAKGLFYYYHAFAAAMAAAGEPEITDADGAKHLWANELVAKLKSIQKPDGSWAGDARWMEDIPPLPTLYSLVVLNKAAKFVK
jgi:squalene-hopene/tetraprenyl-beta-curcumene cyclase